MNGFLSWGGEVFRVAGKCSRLPFVALTLAGRIIGPLAVFQGSKTKVAVISVDTAGREVRIPAQEGICVQWR